MKAGFEGRSLSALDLKIGFEGWTHQPPGEILFPDEAIRQRELELVLDLIKDYDFADPNVIAVCVLKGGLPFFLDAMSFIQQLTGIVPNQTFIKTSSYPSGRDVQKTEVTQDIPFDVSGKTLIGFEDLGDTNGTGVCLDDRFDRVRQAASWEMVTLFVKDIPLEKKVGPDPKRYGFTAPNRWIGGMGADLGNPDDPDAGRAYRHVFAID